MDRELIAQRLTKLRIGCNLSLTSVADKLEVTRATIYKLEKGNLDTLLKYLPKLAETYGCSEEFILFGYEQDASGISVEEGKEYYLSKLDSYKENEDRLSKEIKRLNKEAETKELLIESLKENRAHDQEIIDRLNRIIAEKEGNE